MVDSLLVTTSPTVYLTLEQSVCGRFPASHYKSYCVFDIRTVYVVDSLLVTTSPTSVFDIRTECMW